LYIGQSQNIHRRLETHQNERPWFDQVDRIEICPDLPLEDDRLALETVKIVEIRPKHNRAIYLGLDKEGTLYPAHFFRKRR